MNYFRIKEAAADAGITLTELAKRTGISWSAFCQFANGKRWPRLENLEKVASVLNIDVEDLFVRKDQDVHKTNEIGTGETSVFCPHCGKLINIKIQTS